MVRTAAVGRRVVVGVGKEGVAPKDRFMVTMA